MAILAAQQMPSLGRLTRITGRVTATEDLLFQGIFDGHVEAPAHRVTVGPSAEITGDIKAREVVVQGTVKGNLAATEKIAIHNQACVSGDLRTPRIQIEDGANVEGSISMGASPGAVAKKLSERARVIAEGPSFMVVGGEG